MKTMLANELKDVLSIMNLAAGTDRNVENGNKVYFTGKKIYIFSGDAYISKDLETDFKGGVDTNLLEDIIDKYGLSEIELDRKENEIIVKKKRSISKLVVDDSDHHPSIKFSEETEWRKVPADFTSLLDQAFTLTGNNFTEPSKTCIHINARKMEASDGLRFGIFKMKGMISDDIFIRKDFVKILSKFEPKDYRLADSWICFTNEKNYFLAIRKISITDYPNLEEIFQGLKKSSEIELQDKIISSLERAGLFLRNEMEMDRYIKLEAKEGKIHIFTQTKAGTYKDKFNCAEGIEFEISINPKYLVEMIYYSNKISIGDQAVCCETKNAKIAACLIG